MGVFPPTGLEYVATSAKGLTEKITLLDMRYEKEFSDLSKLADFIREEKVDIVCSTIGWDRQFDEVCARFNAVPDGVPLVVGGYKATERVEEVFEKSPKVGIVARGEGEETIKDILNGAPLESIEGISYRKGSEIAHNKNRPLPDVNKIAAIDRSLRRCEYALKLGSTRILNMAFDCVLSARGCPHNCKFCTFNLNPLGQKRMYAARNVESVIEELEGVSASMVLFSDDNFFSDMKRAERICDIIIERKIKKRFMAQARIEIGNYPAVLDKVVKAGFKVLLLGLESPHDHILEQLNKGFNTDAVRKAFSVLRKYPIYTHGYFIYGNIGELENDMMRIPAFAKEIGVDSIACSKLRIDRFSPLKKLAESTPGYHVTYRGEVYSDMYSHPALKKIGRKMKFAFYTPLQLLKIGWKFLRIRFLTFREIMSFIFAVPLLLKHLIARDLEKKRLRDSIRRIFFRNK